MEPDKKLPKKLMSIAEYCEVYDVGTTVAYEHINRGEVEAVTDGRRTKITVESAERRVANLPRVKPKPPSSDGKAASLPAGQVNAAA
jgi:hypothetical protein